MPEPTNQPESVLAQTVRKLGPASLLALGAAVLPPVGSLIVYARMNNLGEWLRSHGGTGIAIYIAGFAVLAGTALLPTYAAAILGGWAFGFADGFPAALAGFLAGSAIGYGVAHPVSAERVEAVIAEHAKWKAVRDALVGGGFWKTLGIVTLVRVPPNSPFAITNLVLASVRVPLPIYLIGTLVGMAPRTAIVLYFASSIRGMIDKSAAEHAKPWWYLVVAAATSVIVLVVIGVIANKAIRKVTGGPAPAPRPG